MIKSVVMDVLRRLKNKKGFTFMELLVAMVVVGILGGMVGGLVKTGLSAYGRIRTDAAEETEARAALSLVTVQIRQHDQTGAITIENAGKTIRLLDDPADPAGSGERIYFRDGGMYSRPFTQAGDGEEIFIANVTGFLITRMVDEDANAAVFTVTIEYGSAGRKLEQQITQRSAAQ